MAMRVHVRLGEPFWRAVGQRNLEADLPPGTDLRALLAWLCREYPALEQEMREAPPHFFVGDEEAHEETLLADGNRVHLVWPVAGG